MVYQTVTDEATQMACDWVWWMAAC